MFVGLGVSAGLANHALVVLYWEILNRSVIRCLRILELLF